MDERPVDLRPLDPARDDVAWERRVRALGRKGALLRRPVRVPEQLSRWARPALAAAATVAFATGAFVFLQAADTASSTPTAALLEWARADAVPADADLTLLLGVTDEH
jgi:hypothetical protein